MIKNIVLVVSILLNLFFAGWLTLIFCGDDLLEYESKRNQEQIKELRDKEVPSE